MTYKLILLRVIFFAIGPVVAFSQTDSTIRRKPNVELITGIQFATVSSSTMFNGQPIPGSELEFNYTYFGLGVGAHVPLTEIGAYGTIWIVPASSFWFNIGSKTTIDEYGNALSETQSGFSFSVPVHATISYGALRRKSMAFGIEGGLGINASWRSHEAWQEGFFSVQPSAMIDVSYAPKNVFRLRFMTDLLSTTMPDGADHRAWCIQFVLSSF